MKGRSGIEVIMLFSTCHTFYSNISAHCVCSDLSSFSKCFSFLRFSMICNVIVCKFIIKSI